jgi:acyl-CoA thioesterase YciA
VSDPDVPEETDVDAWHLAIRVVAMPADTNAYGDIFGGWVMSQADLAGSTVAIRVAQGRVATVAVKELRFIAPVRVGDLVEIYARQVGMGRTSVSVQIQGWVQGNAHGNLGPVSRRQVAEALFVYVALDDGGRPRQVNTGGQLLV